jgi:hypothetical protein
MVAAKLDCHHLATAGVVFILVGSAGLDKATDFSYYFIFMLQLWHTPLLPLTTVLPDLLQLDKPFYYYELFVMTPLLWMVYFLPRLKRLLPGRPIN